ncbi:drug/metabolite transporter (DMT)-like permease [Tahibacter aquaticus]|jgi:drug/metabolite transporter (DMT)-like permease|uniref:Drug/metabolite transporter (DMT)-like permease n=1 Tax=Tahibacter aquaticus TaxID=520092 RepID=A0A4R6ZAV4_9GAMM|nr:drug/metabolite exporter YedA [Tahibacter aquaticus]TDR48884.1 drug/metabolite transporter (DMT)-like permease [Tahibacter aquaticus]
MSEQSSVPAAAPRFSPRVLVPLALFSLYIVWGSTYLAIRIGLESFPPFTMAALRFLITGAVLYAFLRWRGVNNPTLLQWRNCAVTGTLLLGFGNGLVCWAQQSVSSGLAAVAVASMPLFAAVFGTFFGQWPRRLELIGLLVGFAGVILLNLGGDLAGSRLGALALLAAAASWAFGSLWSKRQDMPEPMMNTAAQMLTGGAALTVLALLNGQGIPAEPSLRAGLALAYLAVFGSIIGFSAYLYLLRTVRPALATSYAYVNPPVAVLFGALLAGERVHALDIVGMAVILGGVAIITLARDKS